MSLYQDIVRSFSKWTGKWVDVDNAYGPQCVDWVKQYAKDIGYPITTSGNAKGFATIGLGKNWKRVTEGQIGDIVIFPSGTYGHIAVVTRIVGSLIYVHEQNRDGKANLNNNSKNKGSPVSIGKYNTRGDEVFFRPSK